MKQELEQYIDGVIEDAERLVNSLITLKNSDWFVDQDEEKYNREIDSVLEDLMYCIPDIRFCADDVLTFVAELEGGTYTDVIER